MSADNNTQASSQPPKPGPEHKRLDALVGKWKSDGRTIAGGDEPVIKISGTDAYEWLPGGFFLLHHVDVRMAMSRSIPSRSSAAMTLQARRIRCAPSTTRATLA